MTQSESGGGGSDGVHAHPKIWPKWRLCQLSIELEGAIAEVKAENINTQREVDSLRTELEKMRLKMSNIEADSKRTKVILYNFDPSRRAQTLGYLKM